MIQRLAKGDVQEISRRSSCTRQYASEIISDYKNGIVRRGRKAFKVIRAYKSYQDKYLREQEECNRLRKPNV